MTTTKIDEIIAGYIDELHNDGIRSFLYCGGVLYPIANELNEREYKLVWFISDLLYIRFLTESQTGYNLRSSIRERVEHMKNEYEQEISSYYPLACVIDSIVMNNERG